MERTLIPISKGALDKYGIPFSPATWRKWHYLGKFPEVIFKVSGRLFIDLRRWQAVVEEAATKRKMA